MSLNAASPPPAPRVRTVSAAVFAVGLIIVAGLAIAGTAVYYELKPASGPSPGTPGTVTVTDDLGRTVTVPYDPSRVVVLGPNIMDSMFRLGLRSHVVGVDCSPADYGGLAGDYSPDQIALWNLSASMCVQAEPLVVEQLLNLTPQLVLAATIVSVAGVESISQTYGIPVVMLQPASLSGIQVDVSLLGEIFGATTAATSLNAQLSTVLGNATVLATNLTDAGVPFPTVLVTYSVDSNGYWSFGPATFGESLVEIACGTSISANATLPYPELSPEQVLVANPQIIIYGTGYGLNESTYATGMFWSDFGAVQDGQVYGLNSNYLTEADPTMILLGLPALIQVFHPGA